MANYHFRLNTLFQKERINCLFPGLLIDTDQTVVQYNLPLYSSSSRFRLHLHRSSWTSASPSLSFSQIFSLNPSFPLIASWVHALTTGCVEGGAAHFGVGWTFCNVHWVVHWLSVVLTMLGPDKSVTISDVLALHFVTKMANWNCDNIQCHCNW